jgi:hypothetical protein
VSVVFPAPDGELMISKMRSGFVDDATLIPPPLRCDLYRDAVAG